jgi:hypothetical protein
MFRLQWRRKETEREEQIERWKENVFYLSQVPLPKNCLVIPSMKKFPTPKCIWVKKGRLLQGNGYTHPTSTLSMRVTGDARDWSLESRVSTPASPNPTVGFSSKESIPWWRHAWLAAKRVCQSRLESASEVTLRQMDDFKLICMDLLRLKHYIFVQVIYSWWSLSQSFLVSSQILSQLCKGYSFSGWFGAYYMHFSLDVISSKVFNKCCRI